MFRLVEDRVALVVDEDQSGGEKTPGGIVIPNQESNILYCKVAVAGPGKRATNVMISDENVSWRGEEATVPDLRLSMNVKEGDTVIISKHTGTPVKYEGREYRITTEQEILAIL